MITLLILTKYNQIGHFIPLYYYTLTLFYLRGGGKNALPLGFFWIT